MPEILPGIHQVDGVDPSPDFSTHVYLVKDAGSTWTLIDCGLPGSEQPIRAYLEKHGIAPHSVAKILLTHLHRDHTGALKEVAKLTRAKSYAHWLEAAFINCDPPYEGPGSPPAEPFEVTDRLKDGDLVDAAGGLVAYHTPGHTPGHTAYYQPERKILFSGDLFFGDGPKLDLTPKEYSHDVPSAIVSARHVARLPIESLLTYHGGPYPTGAGPTVRSLAARL
ncbi:MAG: MBL fold metallo-hydrolase [Thermoplasmata archaeon]|jgi:glyoxylase-like metal-dependent hydrolase (beta-lactamase superfamily II)|nr:MBL fold metallo-hydrolase [Thermoplasmata archaeon]